MESKQITRHQVDVWIAVKNAGPNGLNSNEIAVQTALPGRTVRSHVLRLVRLGIFEEVQTHPRRYRMAPVTDQHARQYLGRLEEAARIYGTSLAPQAGAERDVESIATVPTAHIATGLGRDVPAGSDGLIFTL